MNEFNSKVFTDCAEELLRADETERALWLLDNLPAFYRDHIPKRVVDLKNEVLSRITTSQFYSKASIEDNLDMNNETKMEDTLRGRLILKDALWFNSQDIRPHIIDYGPGEYWLPIMLNQHKIEFTYEPIFLNIKAHEKIKPWLEKNISQFPDSNTSKIFVACEIIEHLWRESDIKTEMLAHGGLADLVHISTPKYSFDTTCSDWRTKKELAHLRAYTPREFQNILTNLFPEYQALYFDHKVMHARLTHQLTKVSGLKERALEVKDERF